MTHEPPGFGIDGLRTFGCRSDGFAISINRDSMFHMKDAHFTRGRTDG